ncbi:hypothetical protein GCM10022408_10050 [Hymenobacter fastidiosus]|uniref:Type I restriction modification DNA specificity domain-containing protein n=1 Tax=Hymenobacter fastidiosus TaxID=486264 RepID=A0ABP7RQI8_9BACT
MWENNKLGNLCLVGDGAHASIERVESGILYLSSKNFKKGIIDLSDVDYISPFNYSKHFKETKAVTKPTHNDLLLGIIGSLGSPYLVKPEDVIGISSSVAIIRPKQLLDSRFLFYYLTSSFVQNYIEAIKSGAAQGFVSLEMLKSIPVRLPPLSLQRQIATVLGRYDALLENYQAQVAALEGLAQELYREWFVRGRCPGAAAGPNGEFPTGWQVTTVESVVKRLKFGKTFKPDEVDSEGKVIVVDQSVSGFLGYHDKEPDHLASIETPIITFGDHSCKMTLMAQPFSLAENVIPFIASNKFTPAYYLYEAIKSLIETQEYKRHWTDLLSKQIIIPPLIEQNNFAKSVKPFFSKCENIRNQMGLLRATRDALLPRLLSGQLLPAPIVPTA